MALAVAVGTTIGFLFGGFPLVVVLRAASHILFATLGALYLQKTQKLNPISLRIFSFCVALIHALCELIVVSMFYFSGSMGISYYAQGFLASVLLLVGLGTIIHSMIDFEIALIVLSALQKHKQRIRLL
jgi:niacin transporter